MMVSFTLEINNSYSLLCLSPPSPVIALYRYETPNSSIVITASTITAGTTFTKY